MARYKVMKFWEFVIYTTSINNCPTRKSTVFSNNIMLTTKVTCGRPHRS